jgi:hypothetical protein
MVDRVWVGMAGAAGQSDQAHPPESGAVKGGLWGVPGVGLEASSIRIMNIEGADMEGEVRDEWGLSKPLLASIDRLRVEVGPGGGTGDAGWGCATPWAELRARDPEGVAASWAFQTEVPLKAGETILLKVKSSSRLD